MSMFGNGSSSSPPASSAPLPVAVDTMGGDHGLEPQVEGAVLAFREFGVSSILVGPEEQLKSKLDALGAKQQYPITVVAADDVITMEDSPVKAVRRKPNSSLCVAYQLVQSGKAGSIISSGNSGAMMAAGRLICGLLPGIERPAIATLIPTVGDGKPNVIIDSGANVDCHAQNLVQFAVMGSVYCSSLFDIARPRVALLSNGTEASKGTDVIRAASMFLSSMDSLNYVGYVEGRDVAGTAANVIVCDGFVGNVLLKSMEGCVRLIFEQIVHDARKSLLGTIGLGLSKRVYRGVFLEKFDYTAHGGAPLLGLKKLAVVLHGSSGSRAVKNAIRVADSFARSRMVEKISSALSQIEEQMPEVEGDWGSMFAKGGELEVDGIRRKRRAKDEELDPVTAVEAGGDE